MQLRHLLSSLALCGALIAPTALRAESPVDPALVQRAGRIVETLGLTDATQADRVRSLIARQYADLRPIHEARDAALQSAKGDDAASARVRSETQARLATLHYSFLGRLGAELSPTQIDQVKDGMTYGVVPLTFRVYQQMLPALTAEQKRQIHAWLIEAREHAMDGGSSEEKHGVFGKYKGRINNYLSAAGYDLKAAEKNLRKKP